MLHTTLNTIRWILVGLVAAILVVPAAYLFLSHERLVEIDGASMSPTYRVGDLVLVGDAVRSDYAVGHVVSVSAPGGIYTHRIIKITDGKALLKGDGNKFEDPTTISYKDVVGAVRGNIGGPASASLLAVESIPGRIALFVVMLGLLFVPIPGAPRRTRPQRLPDDGPDAQQESAPRTVDLEDLFPQRTNSLE